MDKSRHSDHPEKFVCYYRVSTRSQFISHLGIEAQEEAVSRFLAGRPNATVIQEFSEAESGKKNDRPALEEALGLCRKHKATLLIAKLDRLARNVHFISGLLERRVDILALDYLSRDRFQLHLGAAFAEEERRRISERTKAAMAAGKRAGKIYGASARDVLAPRFRAEALEKAKSYRGVVRDIWAGGAKTTKEVMAELNRREVLTPGGSKTWHYSNTYKLLRRLDELGHVG